YALRESLLGPDNPATCDCRNKLAIVYRDAGHPEDASRLYDLNRLTKKGEVATKKGTPPGPSATTK
ncbi:MAG TPA: tetratricopeptide repeat protein, partial [Nitrospira sp.]|nr:tetratricopeptide repeat protein [Nitrospira sp.]